MTSITYINHYHMSPLATLPVVTIKAPPAAAAAADPSALASSNDI